jgi:solute carrier family 45 protein 1/2/4
VAVVAGALLPHLSRRDKRLLAHSGEDEETELERLTALVLDWKDEAASKGKTMKLPVMPLLLRTVWMGALLLFSLIAFSTFFVETVASVSFNRRSLIQQSWAQTNPRQS